ncbi:hypothetical protein P170DRAFT_429046 [Aspergillus steynii IBT 23096]|uniref:Uncharacterized protein n=1 Tax=Aspergillus steynii IBT 23096 TaxID=1392250 RepID=A0A2I2FZ12_9EURO|nr:uncharacterized protein P170DRAFT_429046 [Aspergillus steynii IBT 23096]PLB45869.1 hypothetical protein P170DRAFT_429046 [Aspergillus steynii IBT 23096]
MAIADKGADSAATNGPLPISYGKCYRIQTKDRQWMARRSTGYQGWHFALSDSDIYKVCQHRIDGSCEYDSVRVVQSEEDFFLWSFIGSLGQEPNLLAGRNPNGWFYAAYGGWAKYIWHFQGQEDCGFDTKPCAIRTGGHNGDLAKGIADHNEQWPVSTPDESTVLLWYHEVDCPE